MNAPDLIAAVIPVVKVFEQLNIDYHIGGSVASSVFGFPRSTIKVQETNLDIAYMQQWARVLGVTELLQRALVDAGLP